MVRKIVAYGTYYNDFIESVSKEVKKKIHYILDLLSTQEKVDIKFVKYIKDGIFEIRVLSDGNAFRVFFIFDEDRIVVLFNGFQKKSQKTPSKEIEKAIRIKKEYYENKE
ncbi:MAG: type II toxin-antitoxin system RelE/ParE family toxin [Bacteroidales bacterium]|jgi:putative addiction module killer protein|nr:type II toxin-antitoxin system RelE/ParE family toxin [Bacteroidales bacterium]